MSIELVASLSTDDFAGVAIVGRRAPNEFVQAVYENGYRPIVLPDNHWTYQPVNDHPDVYVFTLPEHKIGVIARQLYPYIDSDLKKTLPHWQFYLSEKEIVGAYPNTVGLNVLTMGDFVVANTKHMDQQVHKILSGLTYKPLHVNQGYVKCTTLKIDDSSCMTSDTAIGFHLQQKGIDGLYIDPSPIGLDGFDHGFIGGAAVKIEKNILFNGDLKTHPQGDAIESFITKKGLTCISVGHSHLVDVGGIELIKY